MLTRFWRFLLDRCDDGGLHELRWVCPCKADDRIHVTECDGRLTVRQCGKCLIIR